MSSWITIVDLRQADAVDYLFKGPVPSQPVWTDVCERTDAVEEMRAKCEAIARGCDTNGNDPLSDACANYIADEIAALKAK